MAWNAVSTLPVGWTGWMDYVEWFNGYGTMPAWKYGLVGESTAHCGIMPFRTSQDKLSPNAHNVLRGEDWAFIRSVQKYCNDIPDPFVWNFAHPATETLYTKLARDNVENAYTYLKTWEQQQAWGSGFNQIGKIAWVLNSWYPSLGFPLYQNTNQIYTIIKQLIFNPLVVTMPDPTGATVLSQNFMDWMFLDYKKLRCTLQSIRLDDIRVSDGIAGGLVTPSGYVFEAHNNGNGMVIDRNQFFVTYRSRVNGGMPQNQLIEWKVEYILFDIEIWQRNTDDHGNSYWVCGHRLLIPITPNQQPFQMLNAQNDTTHLTGNMDNHPAGRIGFWEIAEYGIEEILGLNELCPTPAALAPGYEQATREGIVQVQLLGAYVALNNQWLVNY